MEGLRIRSRITQYVAPVMTACLVVALLVAPGSASGLMRSAGYWILSGQTVFAFGDATLFGQPDRRGGLAADIAADPEGTGYWILGRDGVVHSYAGALGLGSPAMRGAHAVALAATPTGAGYLVAADDAAVFAFGDAPVAPRGGLRSAVDMAMTPSGHGYWLVDGAGTVAAFGDAAPLGSVADRGDGTAVVAIAAAPAGGGYWLATDGGTVYAFGSAAPHGSLAWRGAPGQRPHIVDIAPTHTGAGYWLLTREGVVYPFGDAVPYGQLGRPALTGANAVRILTTPFVNHPPVAADDALALDEDTTADVDVLANDTDADGDPLSAALLDAPLHGTATQIGPATFRYTPAPDYNGSDVFTYRASDGFGGEDIGIVNVTVRPVNDAPVAADDAFTLDEDTTLTGSLTTNDTDVDGDALQAVLVSGPAHGTLVLAFGGAFTYTPAPDYNGPDSFTYHASDGALDSNVATVTLTVLPVPDPPVARDDAGALNEDETLVVAAPGVLANDTDADGDAITAVLVSGPLHGTLVLGADGSYRYTPSANYNGADAFTYRANDGGLDSGIATVRLAIAPVNDAPVASDDAYGTAEDTALSVGMPGLLGNDTDVDGDALTASLVSGPAHGTLVLAPDGSFTYTPDANFHGADAFTYAASDGTLTSNVATVSLDVASVNDAPAASDDAYGTDEDTLLEVAAPGPLGNDTDVDGDPLTTALTTGPAHGSLALASDGAFSYLPDANFNGDDSFTYEASDGLLSSGPATVTIHVAAVNDPPATSDDAYTTAEDTSLSVGAPGLLANDSDPEGDTLFVTIVTPAAHGDVTLTGDGGFIYMPDPNFNGTDSFVYRASDGTASATATATITVTPVADPPVANDDAYSVAVGSTLVVGDPGVIVNDSGEATVTAVLVTGVAHGTLTLSADGSFTYTTDLTSAGTDSFTYKLVDGALESNVATATITVTGSTGGGGGSGSFGGFTNGIPAIYDVDTYDTKMGGTISLQPKLGKLVSKYGSWVYVPDVGQRGHDTFIVNGVRFEIDVLSEMWGD